MSKLTKYLVVRQHEGDRLYAEGDTRVAMSDDVKHLVPHVLERVGDADDEPAAKAEPAPLNKAEVVVSATKAASQRASKGK